MLILTLYAGAFCILFLCCGRAQVVNNLVCNANAGVPPTARAEGLTELLGDVVLNCTGGTPTAAGSTIPQANITLFLNTQLTSRIFGGFSEAVLTVDEPTPSQIVPCTQSVCNIQGTGGNLNEFKSGNPNLFPGAVNGNSVTFTGVPIDPPPAGASRIYRITNVRGNGSIVSPGSGGTPGQVLGLLSATPAVDPTTGITFVFAINNPTQVVGFVQPGLSTQVRSADDSTLLAAPVQFLQCVSAPTQRIGTLRFQELFAADFKRRNVAAYAGLDVSPAPQPQNTLGLVYNTETGFYGPAQLTGNLQTLGLADFGTRFRAVFNNIPNGVQLSVSTGAVTFTSGVPAPNSGVSQARLVSSETGAFVPVASTAALDGIPAAVLPVVAGSATAVWEVLNSDPLSIENFDFPVWFNGYVANPQANIPSAGTATVNDSFAPAPPSFSATAGGVAQDASVPLPRFADTSTAVGLFTISACATTVTTFPTPQPPLSIIVDGTTLSAPQTFDWVVGTNHSLQAPTPQFISAGARYAFTSWSDGGAQPHNVTALAAASTTYTANFVLQYFANTSVNPPSGGSISTSPSSPALDGYYASGTSVQFTAAPAAGFGFTNWSGDLSGTANPQSLPMTVPHTVIANFAVCSDSLSPTGASFGAAGSNGNTVSVTASPGTCGWTASSPVNWVVITAGVAGTGNGAITYNVLANGASGPRSTTLTIAGLPFTVNQGGQGCQFGLTPSNASVVPNGGSLTATVGLSGNDCAWNASSNASWLHVTAGSGGPGGTLGYTVDSNAASSISRTGTITLSSGISQTVFTVTQAGAACTYTLSQASQAFPVTGGTGSTIVLAPAGCPWTVDSSGATFVTGVTITPGGTGSGNGTASYTVPQNPLTTARTGTLIIAGQSYSVSQAPATQTASCTASVAVPPTVALEGRTEVLGDFLLNCANLSVGITADVVLTLNTNVTNLLTSGSNTDATLTVGSTTYVGQVLGYNNIHWPGVAMGPGTALLRLSKVRADASLLAAGSNLQAVPVTGQIGFVGAPPAPVINGLQTMAFASPSLVFQKGQANPPTGGAQTIVPLIYQEGNAAAFTATGTPTRLRMVLTNIPGTVQVYAPVYPNEGTGKAQLYSALNDGSGGTPLNGSPLAGGTYQQLTVTGGTAIATWVVLAADAAKVETWTFPLLLGNATNNDLNAIQVGATVAVLSDVGVASATAPVPRYRDFSVPQKLVNLRLSVQTQTVTSSSKGTERSASLGQRSAAYPVGSNVSFVYQLVNDTSDPTQAATNVTVRNNLPTGLNFVSCTASGGVNCGGSGNQVQVNYSQIPAGQTQTVTVVAKVDPSLINGTVLTNVAGATSDQVTVDPATATASSAVIVLNGVPVAVESLPASGTGSSSTFTYTFTDKYDYKNLFIVNVLINNGLDARNACYLAYIVPAQLLVLVNDVGDQGGNFAGTVGLGSNAVIQNSQCAVSLVSAVGNGPNLTLQLNITFKASFGGNKIAFVAARNQALNNSDWQVLGVWQAPWTPPGTITANGMTPARGSAPAGTLQAYSFTFTDTKGAADVGIVDILVNNGLDGKSACYLAYVSSINKILLLNDAGDQGGNFIGSITPGESRSIQNSQCVLNGAGGGVTMNGQTFTLTFNLTFTPAFTGNRIVYLAARDAAFLNNTDWQAMGSWGVQ